MDPGRAGYEESMSDYSENGAQPVEDAAVENPPTEDEVRAEQRRLFPAQAESAMHGAAPEWAETLPDAESTPERPD